MNPITGAPAEAVPEAEAEAAAGAPARPEPVLELRGAAVRVGGRTLWSGVDLAVRAGELDRKSVV